MDFINIFWARTRTKQPQVASWTLLLTVISSLILNINIELYPEYSTAKLSWCVFKIDFSIILILFIADHIIRLVKVMKSFSYIWIVGRSAVCVVHTTEIYMMKNNRQF